MIFEKKCGSACAKKEQDLHETINVLKADMARGFKCRDEDNERKIVALKATQEIKINELESKHKLDLDQKAFDLKNIKDVELMAAFKERDIAKEESAVLKKEVEMLRNLVDVHAGIIDVKDLVGNLIKALPKIDLQSLTVNNAAK